MKVLILCAVAALGAGLGSMPMLGHHSTSSVYDEAADKAIEVRAKVLEWEFVNPHPYLVVEVTTAEGKVEQWDLSFGGSAVIHLTQQGYTKDTFKAGETVIARGAPTKLKPVRGILIRGNLTRPDGTRIPAAGGARGAGAPGRGAAGRGAAGAPAGGAPGAAAPAGGTNTTPAR
jgi:hypothetical protein